MVHRTFYILEVAQAQKANGKAAQLLHLWQCRVVSTLPPKPIETQALWNSGRPPMHLYLAQSETNISPTLVMHPNGHHQAARFLNFFSHSLGEIQTHRLGGWKPGTCPWTSFKAIHFSVGWCLKRFNLIKQPKSQRWYATKHPIQNVAESIAHNCPTPIATPGKQECHASLA